MPVKKTGTRAPGQIAWGRYSTVILRTPRRRATESLPKFDGQPSPNGYGPGLFVSAAGRCAGRVCRFVQVVGNANGFSHVRQNIETRCAVTSAGNGCSFVSVLVCGQPPLVAADEVRGVVGVAAPAVAGNMGKWAQASCECGRLRRVLRSVQWLWVCRSNEVFRGSPLFDPAL